MTRRIAASGDGALRLETGWRLALSEADAIADPSGLSALSDWIPAAVPGTAAGALADAGRYSAENPTSLHDKDVWYVVDVAVSDIGKHILTLEGLATVAEVYWNGERVLDSNSMFLRHEVAVEAKRENTLALCFRALAPHLEKKGPRARWKTQLATSQGLRLVRTTLLGHMPGWCPEVHAVGPWRPVTLAKPEDLTVTVETMAPTLDADGTGRLRVDFRLADGPDTPILHCGGKNATATRRPDGGWTAELVLPGVAPWWPHTHGQPALHAMRIEAGGQSFDLGRTGFRRIEVDRGPDGKGFGLRVNGVDVFCRGVVWTTTDILRLPGARDDYRPWLETATDAGMNMLRIPGIAAYESTAFFDLCDELGIMVWQDFMFANFDYPIADEAFADLVRAEARQFLEAMQASPSLAVLCGGSEIHQQGAMMGLPEARWKGPLTEEILPQACADLRPDVPWVPNSPSGGAQPFVPNEGIGHYYGVGAYRRPLEDARRANLRFAGECLAFSNVPQQRTLDAHLAVMPVHDPRWKDRVPRDRGVGWDFENVRDHYFKTLYGVDPVDVRYGDPTRYLDLSRAVSGEVMEATYAEWRRAASSCRGALVFTFQDLLPGAGWGVVDSTGEPKPALYALKRAFRPVQIMLTDEGTNGLSVHVINETGNEKSLVLTLACLRDGATPVVSGRRDLVLAPRANEEIAATDLFGAFFDTTYAFRFGPPSHDVTVARLTDPETGAVIADAFHFPTGYPQERGPVVMETSLERDGTGHWTLTLATERFAQSVHIDDENFRAGEDWFHLAPGATKTVRLKPRAGADPEATPTGMIAALNATNRVSY